MQAERTTAAERRVRVLLALEDGEWRVETIAAWTDLSPQAVRADLKWLDGHGFVFSEDHASGERWWDLTDPGRAHLASLSDQEKTW